jgi:hypothetical protein
VRIQKYTILAAKSRKRRKTQDARKKEEGGRRKEEGGSGRGLCFAFLAFFGGYSFSSFLSATDDGILLIRRQVVSAASRAA